ncbi:MAG: hypothetical protein KF778_18040 [Rhodocyclaceae bacterium]|nr:hypothetical protein [Rhodocyclaceae bacterium]
MVSELNNDPALPKGKHFQRDRRSLRTFATAVLTRMRRDEGEQSRISAVYMIQRRRSRRVCADAPGKLADLHPPLGAAAQERRRVADRGDGQASRRIHTIGVLAKDYDGTKLPTESEIDESAYCCLRAGLEYPKATKSQALKRVRDVMLEAYRVPNLRTRARTD